MIAEHVAAGGAVYIYLIGEADQRLSDPVDARIGSDLRNMNDVDVKPISDKIQKAVSMGVALSRNGQTITVKPLSWPVYSVKRGGALIRFKAGDIDMNPPTVAA